MSDWPYPVDGTPEEVEKALDFFFMGGPRVLIPAEQVLADLECEFGQDCDSPEPSGGDG